jgi:hypothetical protein
LLGALFGVEELGLCNWEQFDLILDMVPVTCGNCMLVCWPDMQDRQEHYRLLMTSGRMVKGEAGPKIVHV